VVLAVGGTETKRGQHPTDPGHGCIPKKQSSFPVLALAYYFENGKSFFC
jgi:hypothetical protein